LNRRPTHPRGKAPAGSHSAPPHIAAPGRFSWRSFFLADLDFRLLAVTHLEGHSQHREPSNSELDELWAFVGKKQKRSKAHELEKGDQYAFVALTSSSRAIINYRTGKRDTANADEFIQDLRERVLGNPEISADRFKPCQVAVRDAFRNSAFGTISKTSMTHFNVTEASRRYSPAQVVAVARDVVARVPAEISTS
jgi:IS1 family transposase